MPKKSLQAWYNEGEINYSQKEIISKFGVGDYYPECERRDFLKIWHWNNILERNISMWGGNHDAYLVYQMNFFSTWWNNNLLLFIDGKENSYHLRLIVYEMPHKKMRGVFEVFFVGWICPGDLSEAQRELKEIERKLRSDNPILYSTLTEKLKIWYFDDYNSGLFPITYGGVIGNEKIKRIELEGSDFYVAKNNPDDYFKPLDIILICKGKMVHACIYLGSNKICHALSGNQVRIGDWNNFFILTGANKMLRYHPVITFKKTDEIIKHIANCVEGQETYFSEEKKRDFDINDNNCENFTNRCVLGIDFSQLIETRKKNEYGTDRTTELNIEKQLNKTKSDLDEIGYKLNKLNWSKINDRDNRINEIQEYRRNSGYESFEVMRDGIKMDACVEVQPKSRYIFKEMYQKLLDRNRQ